ncbi:MAG: LytTR family transcriptional regulator DNA-binding domain-containing protein [Lachnospiraceae bacterium]|nr:LytTR family transcriptional regulator DNA-binding domain-containing protein [Lachnospiraceae bacterium]
MKYTIKQILSGEDELILKYKKLNPDVEHILQFLNNEQEKLNSYDDKTLIRLEPSDILYIESVDGKTFAYTMDKVLRMDYTLYRLEQLLKDIRFFRCSKSMILNIDKVKSLKSLPSNRIDAAMCNGEHILISRTYASDFRKRLKGGAHYA